MLLLQIYRYFVLPQDWYHILHPWSVETVISGDTAVCTTPGKSSSLRRMLHSNHSVAQVMQGTISIQISFVGQRLVTTEYHWHEKYDQLPNLFRWAAIGYY